MTLTVSKVFYFIGALCAIVAGCVAGVWPLTVVGMLCFALASYLLAIATA